MKPYKVTFVLNGKEQMKGFDAPSPGEAFARAQKLFPEAKMIRAELWGGYRDGDGYTAFQPPPVQRAPQKEPRPHRVPKPSETEGTMPFYDEALSSAPRKT